MTKVRIFVFAAAALATAAVMGCAKAPSSDPAPSGAQNRGGAAGPQARLGPQASGGRRMPTIAVPASIVRFGPLTADHTAAGSVQPATQSQVAAQVGGVVSRVIHKAGDWVATGAVVVQLDDTQLRFALKSAQSILDNARINLSVGQDTSSQAGPKLTMQLQSAQSALDSAQKNYDSQKALFDLGGVTASQLDNVKSQVEQAQANLEAAKTALDQNQKADTQNIAQLKLAVDQAETGLQVAQFNLENASIKAPFAGQIAAVNVAPGVYVNPNTSAFLLVSAERQIAFNVPPTDAPNLSVGTEVRFSFTGRLYSVRISQAPSAPINGIVPMVAAIPANLAPAFGSVGTVSYTLTMAQGILVPIAALQTSEDKNYVFSIENGKAVSKPITILAETGIATAVTGLEAGAQVILNPPPGLIEGSSVQPILAPADQGGAAPQNGQSAPQAGQNAPQGQARSGPQTGRAGAPSGTPTGGARTHGSAGGPAAGGAPAGGRQ